MNAQAREILSKIISEIGNHSDKLPREEALTGFLGIKGALVGDKTPLVIVGRAVNGWTDGWLPESFKDSFSVSNYCNQIINASNEDSTCPMAWVNKQWGINGSNYNTKRSAFWRVTHNILEQLNLIKAGNKNNWASLIAWTNLYKISPKDGGNPSERLCKLQFKGCIELLKYELNFWKPRRLLFMTGLGWAKDFLHSLDIPYSEVEGTLVEATAYSTYPIVIAKHPQGKSENGFASEVVRHFRELEQYHAKD